MENKRDSVIPSAQSAKTPTVQDLGSKAKNGGQDRIQKQVRVLHIEDDSAIAKLVKRHARKSMNPENVTHVESAERGLEILEKDTDFSLILLDSRMPGMGGIKLIELLADDGKVDILDKIVMYTGTASDLISNQNAFGAIGGRFLDKLCEPREVSALIQWIADGNKVTGWGNPKENNEQKQIKVLIIDDIPQITRAVLRNLKRVGVKPENMVLAKDGKEGLDRITTEEFDLIITDNQMPNMSGEVMVLFLSDEGKTEIVDKIVLQTGELSSIMQETKTILGGRVLDKNEAREQLIELAQLLMDGGAVKDWTPEWP